MKNWRQHFYAAATWLVFIILNLQLSTGFAQGSLTPPGGPAPTMKTLEQIEPRTPISSLPFSITNSGSYYLTANLTETTGQNGISVSVNDVTIDLNGFTLSGLKGSGTGSGIYVSGNYTNVIVHSGTLKDWGYRGLDAGKSYNGQFFHLRLSDNGDDGMAVGINSIVTQCTAMNNSLEGISTADGSVVRACTAAGNGSVGIDANAGSVISDCTSVENGNGFSVNTGDTISGCSARLNKGDGISAYQATVVDCTAQGNTGRGIFAADGSTVNRCTARVNSQDGILIGTGCRVSDNTCQLNGYNGAGAGIRVYGSESRIEGNHVANNDYGIQVQATNNIIIQNSAQLNGTNYFFVFPQMIGQIGKFTDTSGFITNSNPWINFSD